MNDTKRKIERLECPCGERGYRVVIVGKEYVRCGNCAEALYARIAEGR